MNQQKIQLTQEGYDKLVAELEKLKNVDRIKNLEDLKEARAQGDLSENADYDAFFVFDADNVINKNFIKQIIFNR